MPGENKKTMLPTTEETVFNFERDLSDGNAKQSQAKSFDAR